MSRYEAVEARVFHCGQMARLMRIEQRRAMLAAGYEPHRALRACFEASVVRRALLVDGRLLGLGGIIGSILSPTGYVWLVLSDEACAHRLAIVRAARVELGAIMATYRQLETVVLGDDPAARRFASFLGFQVAGEDRATAIGSSHGVAMRYHDPGA